MDTYEKKLKRLTDTFLCRQPDRVPVFDLFWQEFIDKWKKEKGDHDIYSYYDMDLKLVIPNLDPMIKSYTCVEKGDDYEIYKSGYGCLLKKADYSPMPGYIGYSVNNADEYEDFIFENPLDERRYYDESANILSSAGNTFVPSFSQQLNSAKNIFPTMGLVLEGQELLSRIRGMEGLFLDIMLEPDKVRKFLDRMLEYEVAVGSQQLKMGVDFMYIGGDIAYDKGMFYSPEKWRSIFKPFLLILCSELRKVKSDIIFIYHNCGNAEIVFEELIECGINVIQPLEVKAGLDVVNLKRKFHNRVAFMGNIDAQNVLPCDKNSIKKELLRKLNAAKGGGYLPMSDHSVPDTVPIENFDYYINELREFGSYPLKLGEYDENILEEKDD